MCRLHHEATQENECSKYLASMRKLEPQQELLNLKTQSVLTRIASTLQLEAMTSGMVNKVQNIVLPR